MNTVIALIATIGFLGYVSQGPQKVHSTDPKHDVYVGGKYIGSDPDVRVRREIVRDFSVE